MKYGISLPQFAYFGDAGRLVELAKRAEEVGWDGFFLWDHIARGNTEVYPVLDPWVVLGAIAVQTRHIRIGTLVTPLARRRPWKVAREAVTLDHLSEGRMILGVGLGSNPRLEFEPFGDPGHARTRAELLDEGLDIIAGLWRGQPFHYHGQHYHIDEMVFLPRPVQQPRIPIWVGGRWPNRRPMRRAARWDGACPEGIEQDLSPQDWQDILAFIREHRTVDAPFEAVHMGVNPPGDASVAAEETMAYEAAGVTWWVENVSPSRYGASRDGHWPEAAIRKMVDRLEQGPPSG